MSTMLDAVPKYTLGYPLSATCKIVFYFVLPPVLLFFVYFTLIASDISLVCLHFIEGNPRWATMTLIFLWWPAVGSFVFTISNPQAWPSEQPLAIDNLKFFGIQLWYFAGFPIAVICRYIYRVFWAIEAVSARRNKQNERMEEALALLMKPSPLELYFFLQAYLHCAPQILLQFFIMLRAETRHSDTASIQTLSIATALLRMAIITATYQRFERRKVLGFRYPWMQQDKTLPAQFTTTPEKCLSKPPVETISNFVGLPLDLISYKGSEAHSEVPSNKNGDVDDDEDVFDQPDCAEDTLYTTDPIVVDERMFGEVSTKPPEVEENKTKDYEDLNDIEYENDPFLVQPTLKTNASESGIRDKKRQRVSIVENPDVEIRRQISDSKVYNIVDMSKYTTPPSTPAPRPMSIGAIRSRIMSNAESIMERIPRRTYKDPLDFDLPVRVRRTAIKGIEQEDGISKFIAFVAWFLFLASRMVALAAFSYFYLTECCYLMLSHYLVMVLFLLWNSWNESLSRKIFYFFLGYIYVFCIIEFKMKFIKVRLWYGLYFILVSSENFVMTAIWFWSGLWEDFWLSFISLVIVFSTMFSYMCFLIYFLILKPKPLTVYPLISTQSLFPATIS